MLECCGLGLRTEGLDYTVVNTVQALLAVWRSGLLYFKNSIYLGRSSFAGLANSAGEMGNVCGWPQCLQTFPSPQTGHHRAHTSNLLNRAAGNSYRTEAAQPNCPGFHAPDFLTQTSRRHSCLMCQYPTEPTRFPESFTYSAVSIATAKNILQRLPSWNKKQVLWYCSPVPGFCNISSEDLASSLP